MNPVVDEGTAPLGDRYQILSIYMAHATRVPSQPSCAGTPQVTQRVPSTKLVDYPENRSERGALHESQAKKHVQQI
jgi:hypothetical protein